MPELRRISARLTVRKGTRTQWQLTNSTLLDGEPGWETDTRMLKIGDGVLPWNQLPYYETAGGGVNSPFIHDGDVFPAEVVTTPKEAMEFSQKQINRWQQCAVQDFKDGYSELAATCTSDGTLV